MSKRALVILVVFCIGALGLLFLYTQSFYKDPYSNKNSTQSNSLVSGYSLEINNAEILNQIVQKRQIYTLGVVEPDQNNLKQVSKMNVVLVGEELPMIRSVSGDKVLSSGQYSVSNDVLEIKIYINPEYLNSTDLRLANYYFTRKLLEFLVAVSPKFEAEQGSAAISSGDDKTIKEIAALETEFFGEKMIDSDQKPILIVKN